MIGVSVPIEQVQAAQDLTMALVVVTGIIFVLSLTWGMVMVKHYVDRRTLEKRSE